MPEFSTDPVTEEQARGLREQRFRNGDNHPDNARLDAEMLALYQRVPGGTSPGIHSTSVIVGAPSAALAPPAAPARTPASDATPPPEPEFEQIPRSRGAFDDAIARADRDRQRELGQKILALQKQIYENGWSSDVPQWTEDLLALTREQMGEEGRRVVIGESVGFELAHPGADFVVTLPDVPAGRGAWQEPLVQALVDEARDLHETFGAAMPTIAQDTEAVLTLISHETPTAFDSPEAAVEAFTQHAHGGDRAAAMAAIQDAIFFVDHRLTSSQRAWLEETGWGDDPRIIEWAAKYGGPLRQELARAHASLEHDPRLRKQSDPDHAKATAEQAKRYKRTYGRREVARVSE